MTYHFPSGYTIRPHQKIRVRLLNVFIKRNFQIYTSGQGAAGPDALVFEAERSWGMGANITTALYNTAGEEKALYTQRTVLSNA